MRHSNRNAGYLLRANLKQNLKFSLIWLVILIMMIASGAGKLEAAFAGGASGSKEIVKMLQAPGMAAMFGAMPKVDTYNTAIVFAGVMVVFMIILQALWVMPLMIRNTRGQEEVACSKWFALAMLGERLPSPPLRLSFSSTVP